MSTTDITADPWAELDEARRAYAVGRGNPIALRVAAARLLRESIAPDDRPALDWLYAEGERLDDLARRYADDLGLSAHRRLELLAAMRARWPHLAA